MPPSPTNSGHGRGQQALSTWPPLRALLSLQQCINFQNGVSISSGVLLMAEKFCLWFFILTRLKLSGCNEKGNWIRLLHYHTISSSPKKSLTTTTNSHGYISNSNIKGYRCFLLQKPYEQWACYYTFETICNVVFILSNTHCQLERSFLSSTDTAIANAMSNWTYPIRIALSF